MPGAGLAWLAPPDEVGAEPSPLAMEADGARARPSPLDLRPGAPVEGIVPAPPSPVVPTGTSPSFAPASPLIAPALAACFPPVELYVLVPLPASDSSESAESRESARGRPLEAPPAVPPCWDEDEGAPAAAALPDPPVALLPAAPAAPAAATSLACSARAARVAAADSAAD